MMETSEEQFPHLLGDLVARLNNVLSQQGEIPAMGLLLMPDETIKVVLGLWDENVGLAEIMNELQQEVIEQVKARGAMATCIAYPDYSNNEVIALLENEELYCLSCVLPVIRENGVLTINTEQIRNEDGSIHIFGEN